MRFRLSFILIFTFVFFSSAQTKQEKEERISVNDFPVDSKTFLLQLPDNVKRLKYFKEIDGDKTSYEAKFKFNKKYYSIEFNENGLLEDIEIHIKKRDIPKVILKQIEGFLETTFKKYRFLKIQEQYINTSGKNDIQFFSDAQNISEALNPNYEIVIEGKSQEKREMFEAVFDSKGDLLSSRPILPSSYDYVLY